MKWFQVIIPEVCKKIYPFKLQKYFQYCNHLFPLWFFFKYQLSWVTTPDWCLFAVLSWSCSNNGFLFPYSLNIVYEITNKVYANKPIDSVDRLKAVFFCDRSIRTGVHQFMIGSPIIAQYGSQFVGIKCRGVDQTRKRIHRYASGRRRTINTHRDMALRFCAAQKRLSLKRIWSLEDLKTVYNKYVHCVCSHLTNGCQSAGRIMVVISHINEGVAFHMRVCWMAAGQKVFPNGLWLSIKRGRWWLDLCRTHFKSNIEPRKANVS